MIVEDFETIRFRISRHFTNRGFEVYSSVSAHEAAKLAGEVQPDLVLIDYNLRGQSVVKCILQLRQQAKDSCIVVLGDLSPDATSDLFLEAGQCKVLSDINSPFALDQIIEELHSSD